MKHRGLMIGIFGAEPSDLASRFSTWSRLARPSKKLCRAAHSWDLSKQAAIIWVNDSGKPCKITWAGTSEGPTMNVTIILPKLQ